MARSATTLSLPPFEGATRKLILANVIAFFGFIVLGLAWPQAAGFAAAHLGLVPAQFVRGELWQAFTYAFLPLGLLSELFALLTLWFCGAMLEGAYGSRWLYELYFVSAIGGAVLASAFSFTRLLHLSPETALGAGPFAGTFGLLIAIAIYFGDTEFLLFFVLRVKAKYMVAIYLLVALARLLTQANEFDSLLVLCGALCGWLLIKYAPRRGLAYLLTERWYSLRNEYYRNKRRNAAKKFEVYMRKQNREVHFDANGKYIEPGESRDPNDKRWMN